MHIDSAKILHGNLLKEVEILVWNDYIMIKFCKASTEDMAHKTVYVSAVKTGYILLLVP